jgi:peptide/nickel transport system substrate-binding protein
MGKRMFSALVGVALLAMSSSASLAQAADQRLSMAINPEPATLILGLNLQAPTQTIGGKIYEGLIVFDKALDPQPSLAESWEISADGKTYTFNLQENVKWHDGAPFSSADVAFSLGTMLPQTHPIARTTLAVIDTIETPDDDTVVITLKNPFNAFLTALAMNTAPMMPKHIYEGTDYAANPANETPIGTGPFKLKEWKKGEYILLERNSDYWQADRPHLDEILFRVIPDEAARSIALENGDVQVTSFSDIEYVDVERFRSNDNFEVTYEGYEFFSPLMWIEINHRVGPLGDKRYRQALMYALDRNFIADAIWFGSAKPATGPISSTMKYYSADVPEYPYNPAKAEQLLDEMGLTPDASGVRHRVKLLGLPYGTTFVRTGEYIKQALSKVGIEVTLESVDRGTWAQRVAAWDYELTLDFVYQLGHPAIGIHRTYSSSNIRNVLFSNTMGYSNPEVDTLFDEATVETDQARLQETYTKAQQVLVDDVPLAWLIEIKFPTIHAKTVEGLVTTAHGVNGSFADVQIAE